MTCPLPHHRHRGGADPRRMLPFPRRRGGTPKGVRPIGAAGVDTGRLARSGLLLAPKTPSSRAGETPLRRRTVSRDLASSPLRRCGSGTTEGPGETAFAIPSGPFPPTPVRALRHHTIWANQLAIRSNQLTIRTTHHSVRPDQLTIPTDHDPIAANQLTVPENHQSIPENCQRRDVLVCHGNGAKLTPNLLTHTASRRDVNRTKPNLDTRCTSQTHSKEQPTRQP